MDRLGNSIICVVAAAIIAGILKSFSREGSGTGTLIRLICGLFLVFQLISMFADLDYGVVTTFAEGYADAGDQVAGKGQAMADAAMYSSIKSETEAYILDKAAEYGAALSVDVTLSPDNWPVPVSARIQGRISPYAKAQLVQMMEQELGIPKEKQQWIE